jgi:hypothetical protein
MFVVCLASSGTVGDVMLNVLPAPGVLFCGATPQFPHLTFRAALVPESSPHRPEMR